MSLAKYPLGLILIEPAHQLSTRRMALRADWLPCLQDEEADALKDFDCSHFKTEHRIDVDLARLNCGILDRRLASGSLGNPQRPEHASSCIPGSDGARLPLAHAINILA